MDRNDSTPANAIVTRDMLVWWLRDAASMLRANGSNTHCQMLHLAAERLEQPDEPDGDDAKGEAHSRLMRALYEWKNAGGSVDEVADSVRQMAEACNTPTKE